VRRDEVRVELAVPERADAAELRACEALLGAEERARAAELRAPGLRPRYVVAHALLRRAVAAAAGVAAERLAFRTAASGRPELAGPPEAAGLRFSLSHTEGLVACALVRELDVGIDVEAGARLGDPLPLARRFFAREEAAALAAAPAGERRARFLELWVLKEALLKAEGVGIAGGLARVAFSVEEGRPRLALAGDPEASRDWQLVLWQPTPRHRLGLAVRRGARRDLELVVRG
jgi:4'-phosphopantetheinyl transferase